MEPQILEYHATSNPRVKKVVYKSFDPYLGGLKDSPICRQTDLAAVTCQNAYSRRGRSIKDNINVYLWPIISNLLQAS